MHNRTGDVHGDVYFTESTVAERAGNTLLAGFHFLRLRQYSEAVRQFRAAIAADPDEERAHVGLALASLQGVRPHRHTKHTINTVLACVAAARRRPEAAVIAEIVHEDAALAWRTDRFNSRAVDLVGQVDPRTAAWVLQHAPAPGAPIHSALVEMAARR
jgi:hypothetical protein